MSLTELPFFQHVRWRPDSTELRRFAISMFVGFAIMGLVAAWRMGEIGKGTIVLWSIGVALAVGTLLPRLGRAVYLAVYLPTSIIGYITGHVALALIFFLVFTPVGIVMRLFGKDPLQLRLGQDKARWRHLDGVKDADSYYRQF